MSPSFLNINKLNLLLLKYLYGLLCIWLLTSFFIQQKFSTYLNPHFAVIFTTLCIHSFSNQINKNPALTISATFNAPYHSLGQLIKRFLSLQSLTKSSIVIFPATGSSPGNKKGGSMYTALKSVPYCVRSVDTILSTS